MRMRGQTSGESRLKLGESLVMAGHITPDELEVGLRVSRTKSVRLGRSLTELGYIDEELLARHLAKFFDAPFLPAGELSCSQDLVKKVPRGVAERLMALPMRFEGDQVLVATDDPMDLAGLDEMRELLGAQVKALCTSTRAIRNAINHYYTFTDTIESVLANFKARPIDQLTGSEDLKRISNEAPIVRLSNLLLREASARGVSSLHLNPRVGDVRVSVRRDAFLQDMGVIPRDVLPALATRLKAIVGLNISERRVPQAGFIRTEVDSRAFDLRVQTIPTINGERLVLKVSGGDEPVRSLDSVGLTEGQLEQVSRLLAKPDGLTLLVASPGQGLTTSYYSVLLHLNHPTRSIISIEDPIEKIVSGVSQLQVTRTGGFGLDEAVQQALDSDADVVCIDLLRTPADAQRAVSLALSGKSVVAGVRSTSAFGAIDLLVHLGLDRSRLASALNGVVSQRLLRQNCPRCMREHKLSLAEGRFPELEGRDVFWHGQGCPECRYTGYEGAAGLFELLIVYPEIRVLLERSAPLEKLQEAAKVAGYQPLRDSAIRLVVEGLTTPDEVDRVLPLY
jgi:type II secretory ATPase GspE/PulE/Tfp pilus assembly ATPase PilB-like protein